VNRLTLVALLTLAGAARAANICSWEATGPHATLKQRLLTQQLEARRQLNHDWMAKAHAATPRFSQTKIGDLLLPGSHDAGTFGTPENKASPVVKWKPGFGITQTHSLLEQLCLGARWFDVRLTPSKSGGGWRIFHGAVPLRYVFATGDETLEQFAAFVEDPAHADEFFFVRLKIEDATAQQRGQLFSAWVRRLGAHVVTRTGTGGFAKMTPADVKRAGTGAGGRVFLLDYDKEKVGGMPSDIASSFFNYIADQTGTFSDKVKLSEMKTSQQAALDAYNAGDKGRPYATWWTSTGKFPAYNVKANTRALWPAAAKSPDTELETFIKANKCRIGSFLIVDFFGDTALQGQAKDVVMDFAFKYNVAAASGQQPALCASSGQAAPGPSGTSAPAKANSKK
jgi:hypothetical protein